MEYPIIFLSVAVIAVALVFVGLRGNRSTKRPQRSLDFAKRRESALWATAVVTDSKGGITGETGGQTCMSLMLEVTPPGKETYRVHADWLVQLSALSLLSPGSEIKVKIDVQNPGIVYPGSSWASYISYNR